MATEPQSLRKKGREGDGHGSGEKLPQVMLTYTPTIHATENHGDELEGRITYELSEQGRKCLQYSTGRCPDSVDFK